MGVFLVILLIVLALFLIMCIIATGIFLGESSGILNDQILEEYLNNLGENYSVYHSEYSHRIDPDYQAKVKRSIERSNQIFTLLFPYYIEYIGVIPAWSKSKPRIDAMFATGVKTDWKRKKLGLQ